MRIVAVDDEALMLARLKRCILEAEPSSELFIFNNARDTLSFAAGNKVDVFFLDISMPVMDGVTLAKNIKLMQPRTNIIFATGYAEYMPDAFLLNVSGYLMKPVTTKQVREQLDILRFPIYVQPSKRIRLQCFGNFEVFFDERPIWFRHGKTKEILAYLTFRRGSTCSVNEIMAAIWEDDAHKSYFRDLRKDLVSTLAEKGCADIIEAGRGKLALITEKVDCDYYEWLSGTVSGINAYHGEFMSQYSWAEFVNASMQGNL